MGIYEFVDFMEAVGSARVEASPCVFHHGRRSIKCVVHGDDFTILGTEYDLDWLRRKICERYYVKFTGIIGPEEKDDKSIIILNRVVEWTGWTII